MSAGHASMQLIGAYARGDTDIAADELWALEAHLETCGVCRDRLSAAVPALAPEVAALVDSVRSHLAPQLAAVAVTRYRGRWSARLSRWLTPAMVPWLAMVVSVTLLAFLLDLVGTGSGQASLVLLLSPVLPVLGVAASWSRGLDSAWELTASVPRAGLPLVLRRTVSVLAVVVPALVVGGWMTGVAGLTAAQWLLPCLAFTSATLALGSVVGASRAALALVAVWAASVAAPSLSAHRATFAFQTGGLPLWGLVTAVGVAVVVARRSTYGLLGVHR